MFWGATTPRTPAGEIAASPEPSPPWGLPLPGLPATLGGYRSPDLHLNLGEVCPELVSKAFVVVFTIYVINAVEWLYREPLGRFVSRFRAFFVTA